MEVTQEELRVIVKFLYYSGKENTEIKPQNIKTDSPAPKPR